MGQMSDSFDAVEARARDEALAREIKFGVTDMNGWQTAYGYDGGRSRPQFVQSAATLRRNLEAASNDLTDPPEQALVAELSSQFREFMALDVIAWRELRAGREQRTKQILLGPEIQRFEALAGTAERLARYEQSRAAAAAASFDDERDEARRQLIAVALGAGIVIILLLAAANDVVRLALEGEKHTRRRAAGAGEREEGSP
jgi:hypothetical protein